MYSKFNYTPGPLYNPEINGHLEKGSGLYSDASEKARKCLEDFIYKNGDINGSALQAHWFKSIDADVFISHSHNDINKAKALSGWLFDTFGLKSFIDSCVWGYCNDLLQQIDDKYCKNSDEKTYNYQLRNYTTSHVHIMLSTALTEMIDKTECILFINTPESITLGNEIHDIKEKGAETNSPWIYHELAMTTMVQQTEPVRKRQISESKFEASSKIPTFDYHVEKYLRNMTSLSDYDLNNWKIYCQKNNLHENHSLDGLYLIKGFIKKT
ncbi:conserved protein of unknown function [Ruminococcaceae bacterium BL-4]|nr:conserved protein of unknown function [Ruminococcaceae bacterium BL-4]